MIKHRDDWAGDVDITEFAPKSVKSEGNFEDILAADNPAIWESHRPAKGGDAGAMLARSSSAPRRPRQAGVDKDSKPPAKARAVKKGPAAPKREARRR